MLLQRIYRLSSWLPLLFLAGLAALTYWLDAQIQPPGSGRKAAAHQSPDLFIKNFHVTQFDADGTPQQQLMADYAEHFPGDGSITLEKPNIILLKPGQPRFTLTANHAQLSGDRKDLYLRNAVTAVRDAPPDSTDSTNPLHETLTLRTEYLHVRPDDGTLQTDQKAFLESPGSRVESIGMDFNRNTNIVKLHSNIQGSFQPQPR